jgi:hypothetical protein
MDVDRAANKTIFARSTLRADALRARVSKISSHSLLIATSRATRIIFLFSPLDDAPLYIYIVYYLRRITPGCHFLNIASLGKAELQPYIVLYHLD